MSGIPAGAGQLLGKRLGKFEILALLALGGTAEIYLARIGGAAGFEKYVVVKCLHDHLADDAEFVKMFLDEARLAAHLDHSNIVQTMELGQHDGRYYMVMEFLAGLSLAMIVRRATERLPGGRIPVPLVLNILAQSCAGLHYAHEKAMNGKPLNIVHRDISPQNLVISFEGVVKVVDFGIAKAELRETRTRSGTIKGKFAYMSPEQCVANNVDRRTDVFALGVIGHELLTGRRLFKRPSPYETYQAVIECDVKAPSVLDPHMDPAIDAVIMRALAKDKDVRYATAEAFGDALLGYLHHRGIGSGPGDVSRFFDGYFSQELDEHAGRMRELISGRDLAVDTGVNWNGEEGDEEAKRDAPAVAANSSGSLIRESGEIEELPRPRGSSPHVADELGAGSRIEDDDEMPAEPTRIETNPLERINELDRMASRPPAKAPAPPAEPPLAAPQARPPLAPPPQVPPPKVLKPYRPAPSVPVPNASATPATAPAGRSAASPPAPPSPPGRFPDLSNLPTMIAIGEVPAEADGFGNAPTAVVPTSVPPPAANFSNAPTSLVPPPAATSFANAPTGLAPPAASSFAHAPTGLAPPRPAPPTAFANAPTSIAPLIPMIDPGPPPVNEFPNAPTHVAHPPMGGYPVMNAQLSAQIATGATVFPSGPNGPGGPGGSIGPSEGPTPAAKSPGRAGPTASFELSGLQSDGETEPFQPVAPSSLGAEPEGGARLGGNSQAMSARPQGMSGSGPQAMPGSGPHAGPQMPPSSSYIRTDSAVYRMSDGVTDAQRAANLMSPVGRYYPEQVNWAVAAATRARAVPPWLLGILFVAAIGIALALTVVIARAIR